MSESDRQSLRKGDARCILFASVDFGDGVVLCCLDGDVDFFYKKSKIEKNKKNMN